MICRYLHKGISDTIVLCCVSLVNGSGPRDGSFLHSIIVPRKRGFFVYFEVISYPFPQSNVHSMLGYSTYYSQLIRFFRLCNNINDFLFRAKFSYSKLLKRGYKHSLLLKYFKRFCSAYNIEIKYGEKNSDLLFSLMLKHNHFVSCNINNIKEINDIVKSSYVKIMPLTRSLECEWTNKSPLPTSVFDTVNATPPPPPFSHTGYIW